MELNHDSIFAPEVPTEIHGVKVMRQTSDAKLAELGVTSWQLSVFFPILLISFFYLYKFHFDGIKYIEIRVLNSIFIP